MKRMIVALCGVVLAACNLVAIEATPADQKWCEAVEKKIEAGPAEISTPSEARVQLLKAKAAEKGRRCEVTKTSTGYRVAVR